MNISGRQFPGLGPRGVEKILDSLVNDNDFIQEQFLCFLTNEELGSLLKLSKNKLKQTNKKRLIGTCIENKSCLTTEENKKFIYNCIARVYYNMVSLKRIHAKKFGGIK